MTLTRRLLLVEVCTVLCYALFLWAPWYRGAAAAPTTLAWLSLPVTLARHGTTLQYATLLVTICALVAVCAGGLLSVVARMRGISAMWVAGAWLFGCSVAILMPGMTAAGFLAVLLLLLVLRSRIDAMQSTSAITAVLSELWPIGYAIGFAILAWRYNPQLLLKTLVIALGVALMGRALIPSRSATQG